MAAGGGNNGLTIHTSVFRKKYVSKVNKMKQHKVEITRTLSNGDKRPIRGEFPCWDGKDVEALFEISEMAESALDRTGIPEREWINEFKESLHGTQKSTWNEVIQSGDWEGYPFPPTRDGFHDAIEYLAHKYIPDPYPRSTQLEAMKDSQEWKYEGKLDELSIRDHWERFREVFKRIERLVGTDQITDQVRRSTFFRSFDDMAQFRFLESDPGRLFHPEMTEEKIIHCMQIHYQWRSNQQKKRKAIEDKNKEKRRKKEQEDNDSRYSGRGGRFGGGGRGYGGRSFGRGRGDGGRFRGGRGFGGRHNNNRDYGRGGFRGGGFNGGRGRYNNNNSSRGRGDGNRGGGGNPFHTRDRQESHYGSSRGGGGYHSNGGGYRGGYRGNRDYHDSGNDHDNGTYYDDRRGGHDRYDDRRDGYRGGGYRDGNW